MNNSVGLDPISSFIFFLVIIGGAALFIILLNPLVRRMEEKHELGKPINRPFRQPPDATVPTNATHGAVRFKNLVIASGYNTPYTEIDELIVTRYGIFCIELKDHHGIIIGNRDDATWKQFKYHGVNSTFMNPLRQNYKHVKALERLLGFLLHAKIHDYVIFTSAAKVNTDDPRILTDHSQLYAILSRHSRPIYSIEEFQLICRILAYESTKSSERLPEHIETLKRLHNKKLTGAYAKV